MIWSLSFSEPRATTLFQVLVFRERRPLLLHLPCGPHPGSRSTERRRRDWSGEPSIAVLFDHLSASRLVTIAQIEGRVRGAGSEFVLACDMRFAARESAIFGQFEPAFGPAPRRRSHATSRSPHGPRPSARGHVERGGLRRGAGRAVRLDQPGLARRRARRLRPLARSSDRRVPSRRPRAVKDRVNAIALAPAEDFRHDSDIFVEGLRDPEAQSRIPDALERGFQTRDAELALAGMLGDLPDR